MFAQEDESEPPRSMVREACLVNGVLRVSKFKYGFLTEVTIRLSVVMLLSCEAQGAQTGIQSTIGVVCDDVRHTIT